LEDGTEYREEEGAVKETRRSPTSKTSEKCKRLVEEDATYNVPKMDVTYSLREEEDKEEETNVMPNSGTIRKLNRIKNPPSAKMDDFFMVTLNQNDNNNSNENFSQFTANLNPNQKNFYKNSAKNNNLRFTDSDNNQIL
jgi:hypothetical protein